jgi:hypothetical protein
MRLCCLVIRDLGAVSFSVLAHTSRDEGKSLRHFREICPCEASAFLGRSCDYTFVIKSDIEFYSWSDKRGKVAFLWVLQEWYTDNFFEVRG